MKTLIVLLSAVAAFSSLSFAKAPAEVKPTNTEAGRFPASAPQYPKYVEECRAPATEKLRSIAQINGFELDEKTISVSSVDDRWYNPSKYVWFSAVVKKPDGSQDSIQVLTQKSFVPLAKCG